MRRSPACTLSPGATRIRVTCPSIWVWTRTDRRDMSTATPSVLPQFWPLLRVKKEYDATVRSHHE